MKHGDWDEMRGDCAVGCGELTDSSDEGPRPMGCWCEHQECTGGVDRS